MKKKHLIESSNSLLHKQIKKFFKKEKKDTKDLLNNIALLICKIMSPKTDLYDLYANDKIDSECLNELINHYDGCYIKLPSKKEWKDYLLLTLIYCYKIVKGLNWEEVKNELNIPEDEKTISMTISQGLKVKNLTERIQYEYHEVIGKLSDKEIVKAFFKEFEDVYKNIDKKDKKST